MAPTFRPGCFGYAWQIQKCLPNAGRAATVDALFSSPTTTFPVASYFLPMLGLRGTRHILARHALRSRYNSTQAAPRPIPKTSEAGEEFGPSWQYTGSRVISYLVIPSA